MDIHPEMDDFLTSFIAKFPSAKDDQPDVILNLLIKYIVTTDKTISEEMR